MTGGIARHAGHWYFDGDGDEDIVAGNSADYIVFIENRTGAGKTPSWAEPVNLTADGAHVSPWGSNL